MSLFAREDPKRVARVREIKAWVAETIDDPESATVMVAELACSEPGCPPRETVIAVLREGSRAEVKIHKAVLELGRDEVSSALARLGVAHDHDAKSSLEHADKAGLT